MEEFNLRGALTAAQALRPDIAIQLDIMLATDTPDMAARGDIRLGGGPAMSLYSFHGRGTLNGTIPHPALVRLFTNANQADLPLQRSAQIGVLTDSSYVQLVGKASQQLILVSRRVMRIPRWRSAICPILRVSPCSLRPGSVALTGLSASTVTIESHEILSRR